MSPSSRAVFFTVFTLWNLRQLEEGAVAGEPLGGGIVGTWVVRWEGQPPAPLEVLKIEAAGPDIGVQATSLRGQGSFEGLSGYYEWTLDDGTTAKQHFGWTRAGSTWPCSAASRRS